MKTSATLLGRIRDAGDVLAWDEFFRRYWPLVYGFARARGCSEHTAEDIVQEVMGAVFARRDVFRYDPSRGRFRDWLLTVVRNAVSQCRRRAEARTRPCDDIECASDAPAVEALWQDTFDKTVLLAVLDTVRAEVAPRDFAAFELTTIHAVAPAQVAAATGLTRNAVYKARRRITRRLRALLEDYAIEGRLPARVREALLMRPPPPRERAVTLRVTDTMQRAREVSP